MKCVQCSIYWVMFNLNTNLSSFGLHLGEEVEPIPQEEVTPPMMRRAPPSLPDDSDSVASPKLPPRPSNLVISAYVRSTSAHVTIQRSRPGLCLCLIGKPRLCLLLQGCESSSDESAVKTPLPRKAVVFEGMSMSYADDMVTSYEADASDDKLMCDSDTPAIQKRPRKPPRNYSYKASTLPKRISHTTEVNTNRSMLQLITILNKTGWDRVRRNGVDNYEEH